MYLPGVSPRVRHRFPELYPPKDLHPVGNAEHTYREACSCSGTGRQSLCYCLSGACSPYIELTNIGDLI